MIRRLEIRGLVVIDHAELEPAPGLTAITGETGAGKTVVAQALALLVGGQTDAKAVRPGARHALVEATLALPDGFWEDLDDDDPAQALRDLVDSEDEVVVAQRVPAEGRARALVDGQTTTRGAVAAVAGRTIRFSSQHEGRALVAGATQLGIVDAFAGPQVVADARRLAALRRQIRGFDRRLAEAATRRAAAEREQAALEDLLVAMDELSPSVEEEQTLRLDRDRLRHAERLAQAAQAAAEALAPDTGEGGASEALGRAIGALEGVCGLDPALRVHRDVLLTHQSLAQDVASELRGYLASLEDEPGRLGHIEDRLAAYDRVLRRYGPSVDDALTRADEARQALSDLEVGQQADEGLIAERDAVLTEARALAKVLSHARQKAIPALEQAVVAELADLAMDAATVRVELSRDESDPPIERASLLLRANPGLPEAPLADVASGGELSRVLLALHGVAAAADPDATWIFDEVDAGVGGVTATAVATKLAALARDRQVIVITHLPQVAALAERHYRLVKGVDSDGRASTTIDAVEGEALVDELCRMLGSSPNDDGARTHAEELLGRRQPAPRKRSTRAQRT